MMMRCRIALLLALAVASPSVARADDIAKQANLYRTPQCGCCLAYADYLRENGYSVAVTEVEDLESFKHDRGVPEDLAGCHTTIVDGYVVEGHVPVTMIDKLLVDRPAMTGISLPGMPMGSPGMSGKKAEPFVVYDFSGDQRKVFGTE